MARIIPNEETYVGFAVSVASVSAPTAAEIAAAVDLTAYVVSINASTRGNIVQTPDFSTRFETNIAGTVASTFEADFYRDDEADTAWLTLPRNTKGYFLISRFGGTGTDHAPATGQSVEVWPVYVVSRAMANETSNTVQQFTVTCAVPVEPNENATVS